MSYTWLRAQIVSNTGPQTKEAFNFNSHQNSFYFSFEAWTNAPIFFLNNAREALKTYATVPSIFLTTRAKQYRFPASAAQAPKTVRTKIRR